MLLKPNIGIDNIKFGMSRKDVLDILGEPDRVIDFDEGDNETILEWNSVKIRLTFYKDEGERFGYFRTINPELKYNDLKIIGSEISVVKDNIFGKLISKWEIEEYDFFTSHFNEQNWISLHEEYGIVTNLEMGVPFLNEEDYLWPE